MARTKQTHPRQYTPPPRKPHRFRPGTVALREIRKEQRSTKNLLPRAAVKRLVKEILQDFGCEDKRVSPLAIDAIREAGQAHLVQLFEDAQLCSIHAKRVNVDKTDLYLARRIRGC